VTRAEKDGIMVSAVETVTTLGLELLFSWMHPAKDGGERSVPRVLPADKPGDGREFEQEGVAQ
jgi:hypothetical protein